MKRILVVAAVWFLALPAWAKKDCNELKGEIEAKLKAKGVARFTLEVVSKGEVKEGKEVGSCDGGAKRIVYRRG